MPTVVTGFEWFIALYPPLLAAVWIGGGLVFRALDEHVGDIGSTTWAPLTLLIPACNEEPVIAGSVRAALAVDYPALEILVLDDGSTDGTVEAARAAGAGDPRLEVVPDPVNRGKADRLNLGFARARTDLVAVLDADTDLHPAALKFLVARMQQSKLTAAVAGSPHVTNRVNLLAGMQIVEAASIVGLIRRTQALGGCVGVVAGVLGLFRRDAVLEVGGYDRRMATEDIDLSWRLLMAGWETTFEPRALIGMQVPTNRRALWQQRRRWARGQGEVLHVHARQVLGGSQRRLWLVAFETCASLLWACAVAATLVLVAATRLLPTSGTASRIGIAWGVAVAVVATVQAVIALSLGAAYDRRALFALLLAPVYTVVFWLVGAWAAVWAEVPALVRGPREEGVVWDIARDAAGTAPRA